MGSLESNIGKGAKIKPTNKHATATSLALAY